MIEREDVVAEIEKELDYMLAGAPERLSKTARKEIKDEFVGYTERILDALSTEELQSESAFERFVETTLAEARMQMHMR